ncbi:putative reverse transcriptase domain-containing protein [Tanacetum coccineum]|uniref:Reverse transcriptase domain-containing protein n=1 Tax=Tanacetum coccineum TaxID=301880 RepID=A0ABQ5F873_9ASTR
MPVELGSFDAIIGMDWLAKHQAVIACAEKIVRIPGKIKTSLIKPRTATLSIGAFRKEEILSKLKELSVKGFIRAQFLSWGAPCLVCQEVGGSFEQARTQRASEDNIRVVEERGVDWTSPKSPTEIRQFLGLAGYYRRFIEGFSKIAKPMTKLTQKKVKFEWGDKQEAQLSKLLKQKVMQCTKSYALPEGSEDFIAYCDASKKGLGAVLMQREKVISYASRS